MQKSGLNPFMQKRFLSDVLTKSQTGSMSDLILVWCSQSGFGEILDGREFSIDAEHPEVNVAIVAG